MASLATVTEYYTTSMHVGGQIVQVAVEPPLAEQTVDFSAGAATTANAFQPNTHFVRIVCNASASLLFSQAGTAATTSNQPLPAGQIEYKGVQPGQGYKISFIAAATGF